MLKLRRLLQQLSRSERINHVRRVKSSNVDRDKQTLIDNLVPSPTVFDHQSFRGNVESWVGDPFSHWRYHAYVEWISRWYRLFFAYELTFLSSFSLAKRKIQWLPYAIQDLARYKIEIKSEVISLFLVPDFLSDITSFSKQMRIPNIWT